MNRTFPQHDELATKAGAALITDLASGRINLDARVEDVVRGFKAGAALAQNLKLGDEFLSAIVEADAYAGVGPQQNTPAWRGFVIGFASSLPDVISTNLDDILLEYREPSRLVPARSQRWGGPWGVAEPPPNPPPSGASMTTLDTLRAVYGITLCAKPGARIDADLAAEAGMDGNYARLLQAARDIDTNAAAPLPICEDSAAAKVFVQQVLDILPYAVAVLESAKKDKTACVIRECVVLHRRIKFDR